MSTTLSDGFDTRISKVRDDHLRMARGYDARVGHDGLIVFHPKRRKSRKKGFHLRALLLLPLALVGFKVLVLMQVGDASYQTRLDAMNAGTMPERAGAFVLQVDPVTRTVADHLKPALGSLGFCLSSRSAPFCGTR